MLDLDILFICRLILSFFYIPQGNRTQSGGEGIAIIKIWNGVVFFIDPQCKSAHSGYRDQEIGIISFQHRSSQLWAQFCQQTEGFEK